MKFVDSSSKDVYHNLALEEYVFSNFRDEDYVLLWANDPCIVLGKHQNIFEEINCKEIQKKGIKVARRNTGGGTVFQDRGNLNFTFITDYHLNTSSGYDKFINPIIKILNNLGVPAAKRKISDIAIGDKKISGNAQLTRNNRVLHHGTLLFESDLDNLRDLLKPTDGVFQSKAVKSVRSSVTNLKDYLIDRSMSIERFKKVILHALFRDGVDELKLSQADTELIEKIVETKYASWEWNFGCSPAFSYRKKGNFRGNLFDMDLLVEKGMIKKCSLKCDTLSVEYIQSLIVGQRYDYFVLSELFNEIRGLEDLAEYLF